MARPTRMIYVENDPMLRSLMEDQFAACEDIDILLSTGSADEVLGSPQVTVADVALLDLALGADSMTGVELGIALRQRHDTIGIVIYSQHPIPDYVRSMQERISEAWSFVQKSGDLPFDDLVSVIRATAAGKSMTMASMQPTSTALHPAQLSERQHQIMALAVQGMDAPTIARELGLAPITVRKNLSRIYEILVPDPSPGTDLRTTAVLRYAREVRLGVRGADDL